MHARDETKLMLSRTIAEWTLEQYQLRHLSSVLSEVLLQHQSVKVNSFCYNFYIHIYLRGAFKSNFWKNLGFCA